LDHGKAEPANATSVKVAHNNIASTTEKKDAGASASEPAKKVQEGAVADLKKSEDATDTSRPREKESKVVKALRAAVETYTLKDMESNHLRASNRADRLAVATNKAREFSKNVHAQVAAEQAEVARTMEAILRKTKKAAAAKGGNATAGASLGGNSSDLEKQIVAAEKEYTDDTKEIQVQEHLAKEKKDAAKAADSQVTELKKKAEELEKEADVAAKIAQEKSDAAKKAKAEEQDAEHHSKEIDAEAAETEKFREMTEKQANALKTKVAALKKREKSDLESAKFRAAVAKKEQEKKEEAVKKAVAQAAAPKEEKVDAETVRQLMAENAKLKAEKAELKSELEKKKKAEDPHKKAEFIKLKQGLRHKLAGLDKKSVQHKK